MKPTTIHSSLFDNCFKNYQDARKLFIATEMWLKERLGLEISPEKSKIVNLKKDYSEFLGFKIKVEEKLL